jgi:ribosome assembly protein YihI (activator of Der GTPase)
MNKIELLEALRSLDEISLLELLEINSDELVDAFLDKIDDNIEKLYAKAREDKENR